MKKLYLTILLATFGFVVHADDRALVTMNGKPLVTVSDYNQKKKEFINYFNNEVLEEFKVTLLDLVMGLAFATDYIEKNKIDKQSDYLDELNQEKSQARDAFFRKQFVATVSDEEIMAEYERYRSDYPILDERTRHLVKRNLEYRKSFNLRKEKIKDLKKKYKVKAANDNIATDIVIEKYLKEKGLDQQFEYQAGQNIATYTAIVQSFLKNFPKIQGIEEATQPGKERIEQLKKIAEELKKEHNIVVNGELLEKISE